MTYDFYEISPGIFCHPQVMGGRPIAGKRRIPVSLIAPHLFTQVSKDQILADFPALSVEDLSNVERFLMELLTGRISPPIDKLLAKSTRDILLLLLQGVESYPLEDVLQAIKQADGDKNKLAAIEEMPIFKKIKRVTDILEQSWVFVRA